jgi:hypothetical protein
LISLRVTSGIYYDLVSEAPLRNEASKRFEEYCRRYIAAMMPGLQVRGSSTYKYQGSDVETPDIIIEDQNKAAVIIECKATKLSFSAQFAEDPAADAKRSYDEIAKGVFQLWRYFSHVRRGLVRGMPVSIGVRGMVLTLDTWLAMSGELQDEVLATASDMASRDRLITAEDRRPIVFCAIQDLEVALMESDEASFLRALEAAGENKFRGWVLPNILSEVQHGKSEAKRFPFQLGEVLPWWDDVSKQRKLMKGLEDG